MPQSLPICPGLVEVTGPSKGRPEPGSPKGDCFLSPILDKNPRAVNRPCSEAFWQRLGLQSFQRGLNGRHRWSTWKGRTQQERENSGFLMKGLVARQAQQMENGGRWHLFQLALTRHGSFCCFWPCFRQSQGQSCHPMQLPHPAHAHVLLGSCPGKSPKSYTVRKVRLSSAWSR